MELRDNYEISQWYKDGYFWRKKNADGSDGKGDLIFNTCYKIFRERDYSEWAYKALQACSDLLNEGRRWHKSMDHPLDAESWIERIIVRFLWNTLKIRSIRHEFRYKGRMVRDSFIALYTASLLLDVPKHIKNTPMYWYTFSPETWSWKSRLIEDDRKGFVRRLGWLRAEGIRLSYDYNDDDWLK